MQYHIHAACMGVVLAATLGSAHAERILSPPESPPTSPPAIDDEQLARAVTQELIQTRGVVADDIDVEARQGVVTLRGAAESLLARERAITIAQRVRGARAVIDRIEVQPSPAIQDATLQADVENALSWDPAIDQQAVSVAVTDGVVMLRGQADSWAAKQLAGAVAGAVRGVEAVQNELEVQRDAPRTDTQIRDVIENRLRWDARLGPLGDLIEVDLQGGKVTLRGSVGSAYERRLAVADAWVPGALEVDATALEVDESRQQVQRGRLVDITDEDIHGAVLAAFRHDPRVAPFTIEVDVQGGKVTLSGQVDNLKARRAATQGAANTAGVWHVVDLLRVRGGAVVEDEELAGRVRQAIGLDPYVGHSDISVHARNGTVTLRGDMDSHFARWHTGDIATRVAGVRRVKNHLDADGADLVYEVPFHDWDPLSNEYDPERAYPGFQSDRAVHENIERALWWSPYVDAANIDVAVEDGVATLTGTVPSQMAQGAAAREAYQGGARRVNDRLVIEKPPAEEPPVEEPPAEEPPAEEPPVEEPPVEEPPIEEPPAEEPPAEEPPAEEPPAERTGLPGGSNGSAHSFIRRVSLRASAAS